MKAVFDQTSGLSTSAASSRAVKFSPAFGVSEGCSQYSVEAQIQETWGSVPAFTSAAKSSISHWLVVPLALAAVEPGDIARPLRYSGDAAVSFLPLASTRKFLKYCR